MLPLSRFPVAPALMADAAPSRYLVTARKYRPQTFADLVSQEHVTETIQNAIALDRLAHAYLFSGPRGVGKTTAARLLAKAINCQTPLDQREGAEPCRTCDSCTAFEDGRSLNIIEIDAASNNSVEDVRDLQDRLRVPPQGAHRKVYIVDEVHMLSKPAFNALLKTLEEPPPHVLFIFATTEPHKVLPTILSRCQRFDFRRITVPETVERLKEICASEHLTADDASLHLIARRGDGALRDALSIFDQAVSLCGDTLEYAGLAEALGVVDTDLYFSVTEKTAARDTAGLLHLIDGLVRRGYDLQEFLSGLAEHVRGLYVAASTGSADLVEADEATRGRYLAAAADFAEPDLLRMLMVIDEAERAIKQSPQPRLRLELALLQLAALERTADLRTLIQKLERLEGQIQRGEIPNVAPPSTDASRTDTPKPSAQTAEPAQPRYEPTPMPSPEVQSEAVSAPAASVSDSVADAPPFDLGPEADDEMEPVYDLPPSAPAPDISDEAEASSDATESDDESPFDLPAPPHHPPPSAQPQSAVPDLGLGLFGAPALSKTKVATDNPAERGDGGASRAEAVGVSVGVDEHFGVPLGRVREAWPRLVATLKAERPSIAGVLARIAPTGVDYGTVQIAVPSVFEQRLLESELASFLPTLAEVMGEEPPPLAFVVGTTETTETAAPTDSFERIKQLRHEHPVIRSIFEQFGGEIVWT